MKERKYRPVAEAYLTEWLGITYPPGTWRTNVQLGDVKTYNIRVASEAEERFIKKPFRPIADAVVLLPNEVHIVECKVREDRGKLEQLLVYEYLFPRTPEFAAYKDYPIRKILLTPKPMGSFEKFLQKYGIEVVYYRPAWILEYLNSLERKLRRGYSASVEF